MSALVALQLATGTQKLAPSVKGPGAFTQASLERGGSGLLAGCVGDGEGRKVEVPAMVTVYGISCVQVKVSTEVLVTF